MKLLAATLILTLALTGCALVPRDVGTIYKLDGQQYLVIEYVGEKLDKGNVRTAIDVNVIAVKRPDGTWKTLDDVALYKDLLNEGKYLRGIPDSLITNLPNGSFRISNDLLNGATASTSDDKGHYSEKKKY